MVTGGNYMICAKCGAEIQNNQKFCHNCGAENTHYMSISNVETNISENDTFNRDVMINYLSNIRTLEFAKNKLDTEINHLEYTINSLGIKKKIEKKWVRASFLLPLILFIWLLIITLTVHQQRINRINMSPEMKSFVERQELYSYRDSDSIFDEIYNLINSATIAATKSMFTEQLLAIAAVLCAIISVYSAISIQIRYKRNVNNDKKRIEAEIQKKQICTNNLTSKKTELEKVEQLLNKAYNINLIPFKYRNIYAIYFLYDYISTSMVTLKEALYHCDLDGLSNKLDTVIKQQQDTIIEIAKTNAYNQKMVKQNELMLRHAIETERNTALAAQYSAIAAINTDIITQMQRYYYKNE